MQHGSEEIAERFGRLQRMDAEEIVKGCAVGSVVVADEAVVATSGDAFAVGVKASAKTGDAYGFDQRETIAVFGFKIWTSLPRTLQATVGTVVPSGLKAIV